jgi:anthranilate/para-aminobenzoate synthase component I
MVSFPYNNIGMANGVLFSARDSVVACPPLTVGTAILHFTDRDNAPKTLIATDPRETYACTSLGEWQSLKTYINDTLKSDRLWVIATTYEWGVAQLGIPTSHATVWALEYDTGRVVSGGLPWHDGRKPDIQLKPRWTKAAFTDAIAVAKGHIREGNVYQLNLSYPSAVHTRDTLADLYRCQFLPRQPRHGGFIGTPAGALASCSPEEFFYIRDGVIRTRPIKGTVGRSVDPIQDAAAREALWTSQKDRAELMMITDLMRNDLSQCAVSVRTPIPCALMDMGYVYHLMATIQGQLKPGQTPLDVLCQLAPGGSITGCPKHAACRIIRHIEGQDRYFYTGHMGFIAGQKEAAFNVAIRTCYQRPDQGIIAHTGCGITIDSDPHHEYQESVDKYRFLTESVRLHA